MAKDAVRVNHLKSHPYLLCSTPSSILLLILYPTLLYPAVLYPTVLYFTLLCSTVILRIVVGLL